MPRGRPPKSLPEEIKNLKKDFNKFMEDKFEDFVKNYDSLTPKQRTDAYLQLMEYAIPKQARIESGQKEVGTVNFNFVVMGRDGERKTIQIDKDTKLMLNGTDN